MHSDSHLDEYIVLGLGLADNIELLDAKRECPGDLTDGPAGYVQTWAEQILELTEVFQDGNLLGTNTLQAEATRHDILDEREKKRMCQIGAMNHSFCARAVVFLCTFWTTIVLCIRSNLANQRRLSDFSHTRISVVTLYSKCSRIPTTVLLL